MLRPEGSDPARIAASCAIGEHDTAPRGRHAPPLEVRQDRQRRRLYAAAGAVFASVGYADATAEAIAREAGMSKATFYEHFDNKEDCIIALHDDATAAVLEAMRRTGSDYSGGDAAGRVRAVIRTFLEVLAAFPDEAQTLLVEIIGAGPRAIERRDRVLAEYASYVDAVNREDAERGSAPRLASPHDAFAIVGAVVELASRQIRTGEPDDIRDLEPVVERLVLGLLRAASADAGVSALAALEAAVHECRRCPRLVAWREQVAREKRAAFRDEAYWGRPIAGFGDPDARVALLGLAPAAHGANRTGRVFTGDRSGDFLFAALHRTGFANQPHVAPPRRRARAARLLDHRSGALRAAGQQAAAVRARQLCAAGCAPSCRCSSAPASSSASARSRGSRGLRQLAPGLRPRPRFGHGAEARVGELTLLGCFHPSQQNTFTGKLTPAMLDAVLERARALATAPGPL